MSFNLALITVVHAQPLWEALIKIVPSVLWVLFSFVVLYKFFRPIREDILPHLKSFKAIGIEFSLVEKSISQAIEFAQKNEKWAVKVTAEEEKQVLSRAMARHQLFKDARILWIDDCPANNKNEERMLMRLGSEIDYATSTEEADKLLAKTENKYRLIISDMERNGDAKAGLRYLEQYRLRHNPLPFIFYLGSLDKDKALPRGAFGLTNSPAELLHLILDALERH